MVDLTVVILTKNEEQNLRKCIESFRGIARRFVIVDSYSTDGTKTLAKRLNEELGQIGSELSFYENPWTNHATQFNWGLENAKIDTAWTMRMDADEELTQELAEEIENKLEKLSSDVGGVILRRRVYFMGKWIKHGGRYPELLLRIFRTGNGCCEQKIMDEHIVIQRGITVQFQYDFSDYNMKDLAWWTNKHNWYSNLEVLDYQKSQTGEVAETNGTYSKQAKRKRVVKKVGYYNLPKFFRSHVYFIYRYYVRLGFLDGMEGKIFHFLQAYWYRFLVDAKMYECEKYGRKMEESGDLK